MTIIEHLRKHVFRATQAEFALIAGVTQSAVSRWESGVEPTRDQLCRIRDEALARGLPWKDSWLFDDPEAIAEAAAAVA